jgi:purine nucleosidase
VACGSLGFKIFDVRDLSNPLQVSALPLPGISSSVSLLNQIAAVSAGEGGLHLIDVTDPSHPTLKKTIAENILSASADVVHPASQGAKVIFDCDPGADIDDVGDLAVLHQLANDGELQILGTIYSMRPDFGAPVIEVINRAYGRPETPIAVSKTSAWDAWDVYGSPLQNNFYHSVGSSQFAPDAVQWYRQTLSAAEDNSISIVLAGQLRNMYDLWRSPADGASPLSGRELMIQKLKRLIVVAGVFPEGYEFNMFVDPIAAQIANEWNGTDLPVSFMGIENGNNVLIGGSVLNKPVNDPVRAGYLLFYNAYQASNRPAWSGLGLLFAARGYEHNGTPLFRSIKGSIIVSSTGSNTWTNQATSHIEYLRNEQSNSYYAAILDSLLMRAPFENAEPRVYSVDDDGKLSIWNIKNAASPVLINQYKPPRLSWTFQSGSIAVLWDSQLAGYSLWSASNPLGPWQPVSGPTETIGSQKRYTIPAAGEQYFHLRR